MEESFRNNVVACIQALGFEVESEPGKTPGPLAAFAVKTQAGTMIVPPNVVSTLENEGYSAENVAKLICGNLVAPSSEKVTIGETLEECIPNMLIQAVNYDRNVEMLKHVPHIRFQNLAGIARYVVSTSPFGHTVSGIIKNGMLEHWGVDEDKFFKTIIPAIEDQTPMCVRKMIDVISELSGREVEDDRNLHVVRTTHPSYLYGAGVIFYPSFVQNCQSVVGNSFYVIPSSIHELIVLPNENGDGKVDMSQADAIREMVRDVNKSMVQPKDFLSDSIYYYDGEAWRSF